MPAPVMDCAYTGSEPKCKNARTGTGTIFGMPVPVMDRAYTGTEPIYNVNIDTGKWMPVPVWAHSITRIGIQKLFQYGYWNFCLWFIISIG
jgi:hypothetical protein